MAYSKSDCNLMYRGCLVVISNCPMYWAGTINWKQAIHKAGVTGLSRQSSYYLKGTCHYIKKVIEAGLTLPLATFFRLSISRMYKINLLLDLKATDRVDPSEWFGTSVRELEDMLRTVKNDTSPEKLRDKARNIMAKARARCRPLIDLAKSIEARQAEDAAVTEDG